MEQVQKKYWKDIIEMLKNEKKPVSLISAMMLI